MQVVCAAKAGRCSRRSESSKWVEPQPEKGHIEVGVDEEGMLVYFNWWNAESRSYGEDLIIFPGEANFEKVAQDPSGRTYVLKFNSSSQKHFFWFQDMDTRIDIWAQSHIDALLQDASHTTGTAKPFPTSADLAQYGSAPEVVQLLQAPGAPRLAEPPLAPPAPLTAEQREQRLLAQMLLARATRSPDYDPMWRPNDDDCRLTDILNPGTMSGLLAQDQSLVPEITSLLPPGVELSQNPTSEELMTVLSLPQITDAVSSLDNALRSGGLPPSMMRELGLPESAGSSVGAFIAGLRSLGPQGSGNTSGGSGSGAGGAGRTQGGDDENMETD